MTYPKLDIAWDPSPEGIELSLQGLPYYLPMISVQELRDDMEEAYMLSRGNEKLEVMASKVLQYDKVFIGNNVLMVSDVLTGRDGTVLQFGEYQTEVTMPADQQLTVWRAVE